MNITQIVNGNTCAYAGVILDTIVSYPYDHDPLLCPLHIWSNATGFDDRFNRSTIFARYSADHMDYSEQVVVVGLHLTGDMVTTTPDNILECQIYKEIKKLFTEIYEYLFILKIIKTFKLKLEKLKICIIITMN
jgi:hypothetical protein